MVMKYVLSMDKAPYIAFGFSEIPDVEISEEKAPRFYIVLPGNHTSTAFEPISCPRDVFNMLGPMPASYDATDLSVDGLLNFTRMYLYSVLSGPAIPEVHIMFVDARSEVFQLPHVEALDKLSQHLGSMLSDVFNQSQSSKDQWSLSEWTSAHEEVFGKLENNCG